MTLSWVTLQSASHCWHCFHHKEIRRVYAAFMGPPCASDNMANTTVKRSRYSWHVPWLSSFQNDAHDNALFHLPLSLKSPVWGNTQDNRPSLRTRRVPGCGESTTLDPRSRDISSQENTASGAGRDSEPQVMLLTRCITRCCMYVPPRCTALRK